MQAEDPPTTVIEPRFRILVTLMAGVVAITPLGLALAVRQSQPDLRTGIAIAAAGLWLLVAVAYRGMVSAQERKRRKILRNEIAEARRARLETSDAFQDQLFSQRAILDRIMEISDRILCEGIVDPQMALNNLRLLQSHAADAQTSIDDAIVETRVGIGFELAVSDTVNLRDEIEHIASPFARRGISIATAGPALYGETDPAMFRMVMRSFIANAINRDAEHIDISIARNEGTVVCTVSDDGRDCSRIGLSGLSALTHTLAAAMERDLSFARALGRNQFSIAIQATEKPSLPEEAADPMDVLGTLMASEPAPQPATPGRHTFSQEELVRFVRERERNRRDTVAARRETQLADR